MNVRSTVSVVHAEDSSSASAKFLLALTDLRENLFSILLAIMVIRGIRQTLQGVYEITPDAGSAFFLRSEYLHSVSEERLVPVDGGLAGEDELFVRPGDLTAGMDGVFSDEETGDILHAAVVYAVESAAMSYLSRAEHCRSSLSAKLVKKGMDKTDVDEALDHLETVGYLDDYRFAGAWLRTRYVSHAEGRTKLLSELLSRGVDPDAAKKALDDFFSVHSQPEICRRAVRKYLRTHRDAEEERLYASLVRLGFTYGQIKSALSDEEVS